MRLDGDIVSRMTRSFIEVVDETLEELRKMLLAKNRAYGNSALQPIRVFSTANADEALLVRIDDKLSRIQQGRADDNEDAITDLIGYLILLKAARGEK